MKFTICTLFPEMFSALTDISIIGRANKEGIIDIRTLQIRDFSADEKHHKVDDYTYGGGAGMLMCAQPVFDCAKAALTEDIPAQRIVYLTPQGEPFTQKKAREYATCGHLVLLCGHYEGVDERALEAIGAERLSVGDYVLTGGELAAMVVVDCVARLVPGVLSNEESAETESFDDGLLEYPQYTRPEVWRDMEVPKILLSGDHKKVEEWRHAQSLERTRLVRPDLYERWIKDHPAPATGKKK